MRLYNLEGHIQEIEDNMKHEAKSIQLLIRAAEDSPEEAENVATLIKLFNSTMYVATQANALREKVLAEEPVHAPATYWTFPDGINPKEVTREEYVKATAGDAAEMVALTYEANDDTVNSQGE